MQDFLYAQTESKLPLSALATNLLSLGLCGEVKSVAIVHLAGPISRINSLVLITSSVALR
jgi:hypothetical protein